MIDIDSEIKAAEIFRNSAQLELEEFQELIDTHPSYQTAIKITVELIEAYSSFIRENGEPSWRDRVRELESVLQNVRAKIASES